MIILHKLAAVGLVLALAGCAAQPIVKTQTVTVKVPVIEPVPAELTAPEPVPVLPAKPTNGDLAEWALALRHALDAANRKLNAIAGLKPAE